jgi:hypothetical protein
LELNLKAGQSVRKRIKLLTEEQAVANRRSVKKLAEERRRARLQLRLARERAVSARRKKKKALMVSGWATLGAGIATGVVSILFGALSEVESNKVEKAERDTYWTDVRPNWRRADTYRNVAYYTAGIAGGLVVTGAVLLAVGYRIKEKPLAKEGKGVSVTPAVGPGKAAVSLTFSF